MAGSFSNTYENKVLDHILMGTALTQPTNLWVALGTGASDAGLTGEVTGGAYARVQTSGADWNAAASGALDNANDITFPTATADWNSGNPITHFAIYDASTGGDAVFWGDLTTAKAVLNGDTAKFPAGSIDITLD